MTPPMDDATIIATLEGASRASWFEDEGNALDAAIACVRERAAAGRKATRERLTALLTDEVLEAANDAYAEAIGGGSLRAARSAMRAVLLDALASAPAAEALRWRPISTAPEATWVQAWLPNYGAVRATRTGTDWWANSKRVYPTHWQPDLVGPAAAEAPEPPKPLALYRCRVCSAYWLFWGGTIAPFKAGTYSLLDQHQKPGPCCDNAPMGEQMEFVRDIIGRPKRQEPSASAPAQGEPLLKEIDAYLADEDKANRIGERVHGKPEGSTEDTYSTYLLRKARESLAQRAAPPPAPTQTCETCRHCKVWNDNSGECLNPRLHPVQGRHSVKPTDFCSWHELRPAPGDGGAK